jgi:hypothetical protein
MSDNKTALGYKRTKSIIEWCISFILGITFLLAASGKFSFDSTIYENFIRWGYNGLLMILVGFMEGIGGALLFIPKLRVYGIILISTVMIGAMYTHFYHLPELGYPILNLLILLCCALLLAIKKSSIKT